MSGDFIYIYIYIYIYIHDEVHRSRLYVPNEEAFSKNVDVMRRTRTSIENAFEHTHNDYWNAESEDTLSEEWIATTRFLILRTKFPEGYKWADGPRTISAKPPHDPTRSGPKNGPACQRHKRRMRSQTGTKKRPDCKKLVRKEDSSRFRPKPLEGDLRRSGKTREMRGSLQCRAVPRRGLGVQMFQRTGESEAKITAKAQNVRKHHIKHF